MWPVTSRRKILKEWIEKRELQLAKEYENEPLEIDWKDVVAMIIAAFQVIAPLIIAGALVITLMFSLFMLLVKI